MTETRVTPRYITEAYSLLGQREIGGRPANDKIVELFADAGHPDVKSDEVPWCAAFVGGCLARANKANTGTLLARDYLKYGDSLGLKPQVHAIGVLRRGKSSWQGHVGFVVKFNSDYVWLLGGNQSDSVSIQPFPRKQFLGFVVPKEDVADKPAKEVIKDSRRLNTQTWLERTMLSLGIGGAVSWQTLTEAKTFLSDNAGLLMLGTLAAAWLGFRLVKWLSLREYREGRYLPKRQWM